MGSSGSKQKHQIVTAQKPTSLTPAIPPPSQNNNFPLGYPSGSSSGINQSRNAITQKPPANQVIVSCDYGTASQKVTPTICCCNCSGSVDDESVVCTKKHPCCTACLTKAAKNSVRTRGRCVPCAEEKCDGKYEYGILEDHLPRKLFTQLEILKPEMSKIAKEPEDPNLHRLWELKERCKTIETAIQAVKTGNLLGELVNILSSLNAEEIAGTNTDMVDSGLEVLNDVARNIFYDSRIDNYHGYDWARAIMLKADGYAVLLRLFKAAKANVLREKLAVLIGWFNRGQILNAEAHCILPVLVSGLKECELTDDFRADRLLGAFMSLGYLTYVLDENNCCKTNHFLSVLYSQGLIPLLFRFFTHPKHRIARFAAATFQKISNSDDLRSKMHETGVLKPIATVIAGLSAASFKPVASSVDVQSECGLEVAVSHSMVVLQLTGGLFYMGLGEAYSSDERIRRTIVAEGLVPLLWKSIRVAFECSGLKEGRAVYDSEADKSASKMLWNVNMVLKFICRVPALVEPVLAAGAADLPVTTEILSKWAKMSAARVLCEECDHILSSTTELLSQIAENGFNEPAADGANGRRVLYERLGLLEALVGTATELIVHPPQNRWATLPNALDYMLEAICLLHKGMKPAPEEKYRVVMEKLETKVAAKNPSRTLMMGWNGMLK